MYYLIYDSDDLDCMFEIVEIEDKKLIAYNWFNTPIDIFYGEEIYKEHKTIEEWLDLYPNRWHLLTTFTTKPSDNTVHEFIHTNYPELLI